MGKRANENSQMRKEEYDQEGEDEDPTGTWQKADESVIKQRRMVKARR